MRKKRIGWLLAPLIILTISLSLVVAIIDDDAGALVEIAPLEAVEEETLHAQLSNAKMEEGGAAAEKTSCAQIKRAYFINSDPGIPLTESVAAAAADIYVVNNLTDDLLFVLYNVLTWSKADGPSVFSEAIIKQAATESGDWFALAVGRFGYREDYGRYLNALRSTVQDQYNAYGRLDTENAADYARIGLTVFALGGDPTAFGVKSDGSSINLVADGVYHCCLGEPWRQGAAAAAYSLLLLDAKPYEVPDEAAYGREELIDYLLSRELTGGGFAKAGGNVDVETTALVLTALAPYLERADTVPVVDRALMVLSERQEANGGYRNATAENSVSTAAVLAALCALSIDPATDGRFQKNGQSVLDALYLYYIAKDGAFQLWQGAGVDFTATDRCFGALVAYYRFTKGYTRYYDMSTVTPAPPVIGVSANDEKIEALDAAIEEYALPLKVTLADADTVAKLVAQYNALSDQEKAKLTHGDDLLLSQKIMKGLQKNVVIKEVFELLAATDSQYVIEGKIDNTKEYTITFSGGAIAKPMDFDARILSVPKNREQIELRAKNPQYLHFPHAGAFPGKAEIKVNLAGQGHYLLYYYKAGKKECSYLKKVTLGSAFTFEANNGGDYFLTRQQVSKSRVPYRTADFAGGIVPKSIFENIMGQNINLILAGAIDDNVKYKITFNGLDIVEPMDFDSNITFASEEEEYIRQLADHPFIIHFAHEGGMPGRAMVEFEGLNLPDGTTLLFYYDEIEMRAQFIQKLALESGATRFLINHCSDYFIADRAKSRSLLEEDEDEGNVTIESLKKDVSNFPLWGFIAGAVLAIVILAVTIRYLINKKRKGMEE